MHLRATCVNAALCCIVLLLFLINATANTDALAPPTYLHTRQVLPPPWKTGEIMAEVDYKGVEDTARFRKLTIIIGKDTVKVPPKILNFFIGPRLSTLELFVGPPPDAALGGIQYFNVTFRYLSYNYQSIYTEPNVATAWIIIEKGKISSITKFDPASHGKEYDPDTLKEIAHP